MISPKVLGIFETLKTYLHLTVCHILFYLQMAIFHGISSKIIEVFGILIQHFFTPNFAIIYPTLYLSLRSPYLYTNLWHLVYKPNYKLTLNHWSKMYLRIKSRFCKCPKNIFGSLFIIYNLPTSQQNGMTITYIFVTVSSGLTLNNPQHFQLMFIYFRVEYLETNGAS